jgi:hypothetical protein
MSLEKTTRHFGRFSRCVGHGGCESPPEKDREDPISSIIDSQSNGTDTDTDTDAATAIPANTTVGKINIATQRAKVEAQFTALVNGINTYVTDTTMVLGDQTIAKTAVVGRLQARINAAEATKAARIALHNAVAAEALTVTDTAPLVVDLKAYFQGRFGKTSPKLQTVGFTQAKVPQKSAASKAAGQAKAKATKAALGPTGKKQRKAAAKALTANAAAPAPATTPATPPAVAAPTAPATAPVTPAAVTNGGK